MTPHQIRSVVMTFGLLLGPATGLGQNLDDAVYPPPAPVPYRSAPTTAAPGPDDLDALAAQMATGVRFLADDIAADLRGAAHDPFLARRLDALGNDVETLRADLQRGVDPNALGEAFAALDADWHRLDGRLASLDVAPGVLHSANLVGQIDERLHQAFRALTPPAPERRVAYRPAYDPLAEVVPLADGLAQEADQFVRRFIATSYKVPEGGGFIVETTRLRDCSAALAHDARAGLPPAQLTARLAQLDQAWGVLKARLDRVANGRPIGPNIADLLNMGNTVAQLNSLIEPLAAASTPIPYAPPAGPFPLDR